MKHYILNNAEHILTERCYTVIQYGTGEYRQYAQAFERAQSSPVLRRWHPALWSMALSYARLHYFFLICRFRRPRPDEDARLPGARAMSSFCRSDMF